MDYNKFNEFFFTVIPTQSGFTDQLFQLSTFYRLGSFLGYKYIHAQFENNRSSKNIYEFLGFNNYFAYKLEDLNHQSLKKIYVPLDDQMIRTYDLNNCMQIVHFIDNLVVQKKQKNKKLLVLFYYSGGGRHFFQWINQEIDEDLSFYSFYSQYKFKENQAKYSAFSGNKVKLLIHLRRGDISFIETKQNSFIPLRGFNRYTEISMLDSEVSFVRDWEIYSFVNSFVDYFGGENLFSLAFFSDGYKRGFQKLFAHKRWLKKIMKGEIKIDHLFDFLRLKKLERDYNKNQFYFFKRMNNITCFIGERDEYLFNLIHSTLIADIIILDFNCYKNYPMLVKLLASFYNPDNPPLVILLYRRSTPPDFENCISLDPGKAKVIPVDIDNFDFSQLNTVVTNKINGNDSNE